MRPAVLGMVARGAQHLGELQKHLARKHDWAVCSSRILVSWIRKWANSAKAWRTSMARCKRHKLSQPDAMQALRDEARSADFQMSLLLFLAAASGLQNLPRMCMTLALSVHLTTSANL